MKVLLATYPSAIVVGDQFHTLLDRDFLMDASADPIELRRSPDEDAAVGDGWGSERDFVEVVSAVGRQIARARPPNQL